MSDKNKEKKQCRTCGEWVDMIELEEYEGECQSCAKLRYGRPTIRIIRR